MVTAWLQSSYYAAWRRRITLRCFFIARCNSGRLLWPGSVLTVRVKPAIFGRHAKKIVPRIAREHKGACDVIFDKSATHSDKCREKRRAESLVFNAAMPWVEGRSDGRGAAGSVPPCVSCTEADGEPASVGLMRNESLRGRLT